MQVLGKIVKYEQQPPCKLRLIVVAIDHSCFGEIGCDKFRLTGRRSEAPRVETTRSNNWSDYTAAMYKSLFTDDLGTIQTFKRSVGRARANTAPFMQIPFSAVCPQTCHQAGVGQPGEGRGVGKDCTRSLGHSHCTSIQTIGRSGSTAIIK